MNSTLAATLIGGALASSIGIISAWLSAQAMKQVARINAEKDLRVQRDKSTTERVLAEAANRRAKLEELHLIVSRAGWENSQTMSYLDQAEKLDVSEMRSRYKELNALMFNASRIVDMYYPRLSAPMDAIIGQTSMFWGSHEPLLRDDFVDPAARQSHRNRVAEAAMEISRLAGEMHNAIAEASKEIDRSLLAYSQY